MKNKSNQNRWFSKYARKAKHHIRYKSNKVIMLRLDLIGDCTMFTSAAAAIRNFYKDRPMTVVCLSISKPVFERMGIFDNIVTVDFRPENIDYKKLEKVINVLREEEYDILLQPQLSKFPVADIIAAAVKCNKRIAIQTKWGNSSKEWIKKVNFLYDKFIPYPEGNVSEFDYYAAFVRGLGVTDYKTQCPHLNYYEQHFIEGNYYVLFPAGSLRQKMWPEDRFAKIADHIYEKTGLVAVILGTESEKYISENIKMNMKATTQMATIDLMGRTSVADVIDIIGNAEFVVTNDTSGVHIACATKTPSVANSGGWHLHRFLPYHIEDVKEDDKLPLVAYTEMPCFYCTWVWEIVGQRNPECLECLKKGEPSPCISNISYEQMEELVDQIITTEGL